MLALVWGERVAPCPHVSPLAVTPRPASVKMPPDALSLGTVYRKDRQLALQSEQ
jgi:hypothetical protein